MCRNPSEWCTVQGNVHLAPFGPKQGEAGWGRRTGLALGVLMLLAGVISNAIAQVYKCEAGGRTVYLDTPCLGGGGQQMQGPSMSRQRSSSDTADASLARPAGDLAERHKQRVAATRKADISPSPRGTCGTRTPCGPGAHA